MTPSNDVTILRKLASQIAEIATLPVHAEKQAMWRRLNALKPVRPMVMIDQVCWNEMNVNDELTLQCETPECRQYEERLRRTLFQWRHFPVDRVVEPCLHVPQAVTHSGYGVTVEEEIVQTDPTNDVVGHRFFNQFERDADLEKVRMPVVTHDLAETVRRLELAHEIFDGILEVVPRGYDPAFMNVWDRISFWMGVEGALYALIDRPEFMAELVNRIVKALLSLLDQLEAQNLLCQPQSNIHCTGGWTDDLPAPGYDPAHPRVRDLWMCSMAQMFSTVSPEMLETFDLEPCRPIFERFGLVYYGCCEPLDRRIAQVRKIPNLRKISISPWSDEERAASEMQGDFVFSRKPNPALLAWTHFNEKAVREHLQISLDACARHDCPLELILKDLSTVRNEPQRLFDWARIAMECVQG